MRKFGILAVATVAMVATLAAAATPAFAASDQRMDEPVRIVFGSDPGVVGGRFMRMDGCLYVRLDAPRQGLTLIRLDQVTSLQVRGAGTWVAQDTRAMLAREPAHCLEEANG